MTENEERYISILANVFLTVIAVLLVLAVCGGVVWVWGVAW